MKFWLLSSDRDTLSTDMGTKAAEKLQCSFCRKSQNQVAKLISSPSDAPRAYICDECIAVCESILEDDRRAEPEQPTQVIRLAARTKEQAVIEKALGELIGRPLRACTRVADVARFEFGERGTVSKLKSLFGMQESDRLALHVQCSWRIVKGDDVIVASRDLYFPADPTGGSSEEVNWNPDTFDGEREGSNRRDVRLAEFFAGGREYKVEMALPTGAGGGILQLESDLSLEIFPDDSLSDEHWRLLIPGELAESHFVVTGCGVER